MDSESPSTNPQASQGREGGQQEPAAPTAAAEAVAGENETSAPAQSDPSEFSPPSNELAAETPDDGLSIYKAMDAWDEKAFVEGAQSDATEEWFYEFEVWDRGKGKMVKVLELSAKGVFECIRRMNMSDKFEVGLDMDHTEFGGEMQDGIPCITCTVYAVDKKNGTIFPGTAQQPVKMQVSENAAKKKREKGATIGEDRMVTDPFARAKALTKATRNAYRPHIPADMRGILEAQANGDPAKIQRIRTGAGAEKIAELPPPLTDERADELREQARELNRKIHSLCPGGVGVLLPAQFNAQMLRVEHSHERLEDFVNYMLGKVHEAELVAAEREEKANAVKTKAAKKK